MAMTLHPDLAAIAARATLPDGRLFVFGYGSLMWAPGVEAISNCPARIYGFHRRFCLRSVVAWGSEKRPGLCATLHAGGSAAGRVLLIEPGEVEPALDVLGRRETAYLPRHVQVHLKDGPPQNALTFIYNPSYPRSVSGLPPAEQAVLIRQGQGNSGRSRDYLARVVDILRRDGSPDRAAEKLYKLVCAKSGNKM